jgi:hypothetical protein
VSNRRQATALNRLFRQENLPIDVSFPAVRARSWRSRRNVQADLIRDDTADRDVEMPGEELFAGCYWGPREESAEQCARQ